MTAPFLVYTLCCHLFFDWESLDQYALPPSFRLLDRLATQAGSTSSWQFRNRVPLSAAVCSSRPIEVSMSKQEHISLCVHQADMLMDDTLARGFIMTSGMPYCP